LYAVRNLIVEADAYPDAIGSVVEESGFEAATEVANARTLANVRISGAKTHPGDEMIDPGVRHLF
jgi:hypothetical protein